MIEYLEKDCHPFTIDVLKNGKFIGAIYRRSGWYYYFRSRANEESCLFVTVDCVKAAIDKAFANPKPTGFEYVDYAQ